MSAASEVFRAALVTGGSSGIGRAVAGVLAGSGFDLTLVGRDPDRLGEAASALAATGRQVHTLVADLGQPDRAEEAVDAHVTRYGRLDCVVSNAGGGRRAEVADTDRRALRRLLAVHVESAFALARSALPLLRRPPGPDGRVGETTWFVATASVSGLAPTPGFAAYSAAKSALVSLVGSMNAEESIHGVRACALCPGFVDTPMTAPLGGAIDAPGMIRPEDVAASMSFLLSLSSNAIVGELVIQRAGTRPFEP